MIWLVYHLSLMALRLKGYDLWTVWIEGTNCFHVMLRTPYPDLDLDSRKVRTIGEVQSHFSMVGAVLPNPIELTRFFSLLKLHATPISGGDGKDRLALALQPVISSIGTRLSLLWMNYALYIEGNQDDAMAVFLRPERMRKFMCRIKDLHEELKVVELSWDIEQRPFLRKLIELERDRLSEFGSPFVDDEQAVVEALERYLEDG